MPLALRGWEPIYNFRRRKWPVKVGPKSGSIDMKQSACFLLFILRPWSVGWCHAEGGFT